MTLRHLCEGIPKDVSWREGRAWVVNEGPLGWVEDAAAEEGKGTLVVQGYVRGGRLSADRLIHLQNFGDFQVDKVSQTRLAANADTGPNVNLTVSPCLVLRSFLPLWRPPRLIARPPRAWMAQLPRLACSPFRTLRRPIRSSP